MVSDWKIVKFKELYLIPSRNGLSKPKRLRGEGVKFINMGEIFKFDRMLNIPTDRVPVNDKELNSSLLENNDLLFARQSLVLSGAGKCSIFLGDDEPVVFESHLIRVRPDESKVYSEYLYYFFQSPQGRSEIWGITEQGAGQAGIRGSDLETVNIPIPSLPEQKAIAHILGTLDDKIELNRQMNETLEAMAQVLFKSWFVDFDPVIDNALLAGNDIPDELAERAELRQAQLNSGKANINSKINDLFPSEFEFTEELGWIPKGWDIKPLDEIADYLNGLALQKFRPQTLDEDFLPVLKIAQLRAGEPNYDERASLDIKPEYIVQDGDIIFSWSGSLLVDVWCGGKAALNQHLFKVTSESYPKWFYYYYTKHHLEEFQRIAAYKAVTMGHIKRSHLKEALCLVPDNLLEKKELYSLFEVILNRKIQNKTESKTLAKLRDTLLPNLMSGELRIADTEKLAENI